MNTPTTFYVPPVEGEALAIALEGILNRQLTPTPPPIFTNGEIDQPYDYLCEVERSKFSPKAADYLRMSIPNAAYWKCKSQFYKEELWKHLISEYCDQGSEACN